MVVSSMRIWANFHTKLTYIFIIFIAAFFTAAPINAQDQEEPVPIIDWQKRITSSDRLTAFGDNLMGEAIDPNIGSIVFEHTDVTLPGNFGLEVAIRRRLSQGVKYKEGVNVEFGDWEIVVPKISVIVTTKHGWVGGRCSDEWDVNFPHFLWSQYNHASPLSFNGGEVRSDEYSNGVTMDIPGQGSQTVLKSNGDINTVKEWYLTCTTASDGREGFVGHAPNGDKYFFTKVIKRPYQRIGFLKNSQYVVEREKIILSVTKVSDVHGNSVDYTYDSENRLEKISASDGREITLTYSGKLISTVKANNRVWTYTYRDSEFNKPYYHPNRSGVYDGKVLERVERPDGRSWEFDLDEMQADASPITRQCYRPEFTMSITHPHGVSGTFEIKDIEHRQAYKRYAGVSSNCFEDTLEEEGAGRDRRGPDSMRLQTTRTMSVTSKVLSSPDMPTAKWNFIYEQDDVCAGLPAERCAKYDQNEANENFANGETYSLAEYNEDSPSYTYVRDTKSVYSSDEAYSNSDLDPLDFTNWTRVENPDGSMITYYHLWSFEEGFGGKEIKRTISSATEVLQTTESVYSQFGCKAGTYAKVSVIAEPARCPTHLTKSVVQRDGDTYTTAMDYDLDPNSADYSYGAPIQTKVWSSIVGSIAPRVTETVYEHKKDIWVLGLPSFVTRNGRVMATYDYNDLGQKESQTRLGKLLATLEYHPSDGTLAAVEDALGRRSEADGWKRGQPQIIRKGVGSDEETEQSQVIDDNGWVTRSIDPMGYVTDYEYDGTMGRVTKIIPPKISNQWDDTVIDYNFEGGGAVQTITKGLAVTEVKYDSMFRDIQTRTPDGAFVRKEYDGLGRNTFTSLPSFSTDSNIGIETKYDGLGRVESTQEIPNGQITKYDYLSGNRTKVIDAKNYVTITTRDGYSGPGKGAVTRIEQPLGITTVSVYDIWGRMTSATQSGDEKSSTQTFKYDSQDRLCNHRTPEGLSSIYAYNAAGQMTSYMKGRTNPNCPVPGGAYLVSLKYDGLGRLETTDFTYQHTPDITRKYNDNSQIIQVTRGISDWTYDYDELGNITSNNLMIDDPTHIDGILNFDHEYQYDSMGHLDYRKLPSGLWSSIETDTMGRETGAKRWGQFVDITNVEYHANGMLKRLVHGNGYEYNVSLTTQAPHQRKANVSSTRSGRTTPIDVSYQYTDRGRIKSITDNVTPMYSQSYIYDAVGRLKTADGVWGAGSYNYDALGNILSKTLGGRTVTNSYDSATHRLTQSVDNYASARSVSHDSRGNVTALGGLSFVYDMADQPTAITGTNPSGDSVSASYAYDGNLKRVKSVTNGKVRYHVYDAAGNMTYMYNATDKEYMEYRRAAGMLYARAGTATDAAGDNEGGHLHLDHLGSPVAKTASYGVTAREYYSPYGETLGAGTMNADHPSFTGHVQDSATGLTYMQARFYDPAIGQFLSIDPVTFMDTGDPNFFNRYAYTFNDPINFTDPDGRCPYCMQGKMLKDGATFAKNHPVQAAVVVGGAAVVVFDVVTIPSGEGAIGVGMISTALATASKDALVGAGTNMTIDVAIQMGENGGDLSDIDIKQTLTAGAEGAISGIPGGATGRQGNKLGQKIVDMDNVDLGTDAFAQAADKVGSEMTKRAGTLGATGAGVTSAASQSHERTTCQQGGC